MASLKYTHAVVCRIPKSYSVECGAESSRVQNQHEAYVKVIRETGVDVIELPPDESLPYCGFVEDTAVICNGIALITRPTNPVRAKEVDTMRVVLKKEVALTVVEITDKSAFLEGGDVLFTGKEFFVGLTNWTNEAGARAVAWAFPEYPCTPIKVDCNYHLKSLISMAGPEIMCVGAGKYSQDVLNRIKREATFSYQTLTVPEDMAANVLYINGTLIHRSEKEMPKSFQVFLEKMDFYRQPVDMSEVVRNGTGLSSCCLLIRRNRRQRAL